MGMAVGLTLAILSSNMVVIVIGTSMGGLNADRVAVEAAQRTLDQAERRVDPDLGCSFTYAEMVNACKADYSLDEMNSYWQSLKVAPIDPIHVSKGCLGTVVINTQQTPHDGKTSLRIFSKSD